MANVSDSKSGGWGMGSSICCCTGTAGSDQFSSVIPLKFVSAESISVGS